MQVCPALAHSALQRAADSAVLGNVSSHTTLSFTRKAQALFSTGSSQSQVLRAGPSLPNSGINCKKNVLSNLLFLEKTELRVRMAAGFNRECLVQ